jgi:hypothetical protein
MSWTQWEEILPPVIEWGNRPYRRPLARTEPESKPRDVNGGNRSPTKTARPADTRPAARLSLLSRRLVSDERDRSQRTMEPTRTTAHDRSIVELALTMRRFRQILLPVDFEGTGRDGYATFVVDRAVVLREVLGGARGVESWQ